MNILVLQHAEAEHPGIFRSFLDEDGHSWTTIHLYRGDQLPVSMAGYDALWVLGGLMDVWQEEENPWLVVEKAFIQRAVMDEGFLFLGLCLGHQLLAEVVGGTVGPAAEPEIGVLPVNLTEEGASGVLFDGIDPVFPALQWHSAMVTALPSDCKVLRRRTHVRSRRSAGRRARMACSFISRSRMTRLIAGQPSRNMRRRSIWRWGTTALR